MKRDCGEGELVPHKFRILYCPNRGNGEQKTDFKSLEAAEVAYADLKFTAFGNARLYACDKAGYANCIASKYMKEDGTIEHGEDRRHLL